MNLQENINRIRQMMGLIFEDTKDKCLCPDGTYTKECCCECEDGTVGKKCCKYCKCLDGSSSLECCEELPKMKTLPVNIPYFSDNLPDKLEPLPPQEYKVDLTGVPQQLVDAMQDYGIVLPLDVAHFLAQCRHESDNFNATTEYASGRAYEGREDLGNTSPGDGVKYKGRGYIMLTGKSNYKKFNKWLNEKGENVDVLKTPELVASKYAGEVSAWFWTVVGPLNGKDFTNKALKGTSLDVVDKIGTWVNGGDPPNGYLERRKYFYEYIDKFKTKNDVLVKN